MITNERQYRISHTVMNKLRDAISSFKIIEESKRLSSKKLAKAELDAMKSELDNLSEQITEYETLKSGTVETLKASTLDDLPTILIKARIAKGLSQKELAIQLGIKEQQIQRYEAELYSSANLSRLADVANALELNIYEIANFRSGTIIEIDNMAKLPFAEFPIKEMYQRHYFEGFSGSLSSAVANCEELISELLLESGTKSVAAAARQRIRCAGNVNHYALIAWQCRVLIRAAQEKPKKKYRRGIITEDWLFSLAKKSSRIDGPKRAKEYLLDFGIPLIIEPHLPQTHLDGAAFLCPDGQPVIGMTLRYDRIDNFWFVLFHELIHVMKHLKKNEIDGIFDDLDSSANDIENEADELAGEILIPNDKWETALARYVKSEDSIKDFSAELGISPAIVAGRIRREANNYMILNDMVGQGEVRKLFPGDTKFI